MKTDAECLEEAREEYARLVAEGHKLTQIATKSIGYVHTPHGEAAQRARRAALKRSA